jgi:RHS repeat-associated protein
MANQRIASLDPLANRTSTVFDPASRTIASISPLWQRNSTFYDLASKAIATINPLFQRNTTIFDVAARSIARMDALTNRTSTIYDKASQAIGSINALYQRSTTIFDPAGRTFATVNPLFQRNTTIFDRVNRTLATINPLSYRTSTVFDFAGRSIAGINALLQRTSTVYDIASRTIATINPLLQRTSTIYDVASRTIAAIDALYNRTSTVYDRGSRVIGSINALGYRQTTTYDNANRRIALTDANNNTVQFLFDLAGRDVGTIDPLGRRVTQAYDVASRKIMKLDARQNQTNYSFDLNNRPLVEKYLATPSLAPTSMAYDNVGNQIQKQFASGRTTNIFDSLQRVTTNMAPRVGRLSYTFDAANRRQQMLNPQGQSFGYSRDAAGQLTQLTNPQSKQNNGQFDALGRQIVQILANGGRVSTIFDVAGRMAAQVQADGSGTIRRTSYLFDPTGRKTAMLESNGVRTSWTFDPTGQLINEQMMLPSPTNITHIYDGANNQILTINNGAITTSIFDMANQLQVQIAPTGRTTYTNDANGNRTRMESASNLVDYTWDPLNRLSLVEPLTGTISMLYDGDSKRIEKIVDGTAKQYIHDDNNLLQETDDSGNVEKEYTNTDEVYGDLVSAYGNGQTNYYEFNAMGSTEALLDDSGSVIDRYRYQAFGFATQTWGAGWGNAYSSQLASSLPMALGVWTQSQFKSSNTATFAGKVGYIFDPETGFSKADNRYYDMVTQRWISQDPSKQDENRFVYSKNDPINNVDPSGNDPIKVYDKDHGDSDWTPDTEYVLPESIRKQYPLVTPRDKDVLGYYYQVYKAWQHFRDNPPPRFGVLDRGPFWGKYEHPEYSDFTPDMKKWVDDAKLRTAPAKNQLPTDDKEIRNALKAADQEIWRLSGLLYKLHSEVEDIRTKASGLKSESKVLDDDDAFKLSKLETLEKYVITYQLGWYRRRREITDKLVQGAYFMYNLVYGLADRDNYIAAGLLLDAASIGGGPPATAGPRSLRLNPARSVRSVRQQLAKSEPIAGEKLESKYSRPPKLEEVEFELGAGESAASKTGAMNASKKTLADFEEEAARRVEAAKAGRKFDSFVMDTGSWGKGSHASPGDSLLYHFNKHGAEVGAADVAQYLRKAEAFAQNLRGATRSAVQGATPGVTRYKKLGKFIDIDADGNIISFGKQ